MLRGVTDPSALASQNGRGGGGRWLTADVSRGRIVGVVVVAAICGVLVLATAWTGVVEWSAG